jgi:hypothetical protein
MINYYSQEDIIWWHTIIPRGYHLMSDY